MSWLPRFSITGWTTATSTYEGEGWSVTIEFGPFVLELACARKERVFSEDDADA
jgi:hypothetical protein